MSNPRLQWGPRLSTGGRRKFLGSRSHCEPNSFNGAPVSRRGGGASRQASLARLPGASMGPPSLDGGGAGRSLAGLYRLGWRFNGAPVSRRGGGQAIEYERMRRIRVSRRGELAGHLLAFTGLAGASMGPPSLDGGGERIRPGPLCRVISFNGAPVSRRGGAHRRLAGFREVPVASMGPPSLDGGERRIPS